jgi:murein DD-endopeptidase MepM/ murein hydrolase activator NlpD
MSINKFYKLLKKTFDYSILIVPNSSATKVKSCYIPCSVAILIVGCIVLNIYIFFGYSTQIWQIKFFSREIATKQYLILKLCAEKKQVQPVLEKNNKIASELSQLQEGQICLANTLSRVREKKGRSVFIASRGFFVRSQPYTLTPLPEQKVPTTSLDKLHHNLGELDTYLHVEKQAQDQLLGELQACEFRLDHLPSIWPIHTSIICSFGMRFHPIYKRYIPHLGLDIQASYGAPIAATADGVVSYAGWESGYGNLVTIDHGNGYETRYGHNSTILVHVGQKVKKGQRISLAGATGEATGPHCHYEVRDHNNPINPVPFL